MCFEGWGETPTACIKEIPVEQSTGIFVSIENNLAICYNKIEIPQIKKEYFDLTDVEIPQKKTEAYQ